MTPTINLQGLLTGTQLPALPQSAIRILELAQDPSNGPEDYAKPIEADPGLTGQVLRFVNSSYFGFSRTIANVHMATTLVGMRTIKNFVLWSAVFNMLPNPRCGAMDIKKLCQDSLRRALFAREVGRVMKLENADDLFTAALLQDIAIPLLAKELPAYYEQLLEHRLEYDVRLSALEQQNFGWDHAEAGAIIAAQWNLPETFVELIGSHTKIDAFTECASPNLLHLANAMSSLLPSVVDVEWTEFEVLDLCYGQNKTDSMPSLPELMANVDQYCEEMGPFLQVSAPSKTLTHWYEETHVPA